MKHNFYFKHSKGSALITVVAVAAIVMSMIALSTAKISQASLNSLNSSKTTLQAQQYAAAEATLLEAAAYENLTEHGREEIDNSGYDSEVTLSAESIYEDDIMQRTATINIYYGNETLPRYTLKKLLLSAKAGSSLPIGTIMPWASTSNPDDGTWLECNGQSCSAYPELVAVLGRCGEEKQREHVHTVQKDEFTVRGCTRRIRGVLRSENGKTTFGRLTDGAGRSEIIVTFMSLLEMISNGEIRLEQTDYCGEITIFGVKLLSDDNTVNYIDEQD